MNSNLMDTGANEGFVGPLEGYDSREATRQTQLLEFFGDEPALQCERRGGGHFEEGDILKRVPSARYHYYTSFQIKPVH